MSSSVDNNQPFKISWSGGFNPPFNPNQPDVFNTDLPANFNGNGIDQFMGDKDSTCGRLEFLLYFAMNHPDNSNIGPAVLQYISNIISNWGNFSSDQQSILSTILNQNIGGANGGPFGAAIVNVIVESTWFSTGSLSATQTALANLITLLGAAGGAQSQSAIIRDAYNTAEFWQGFQLTQFTQKYFDPNTGKPAWVGSWNGTTIYQDLDGQTCWTFIDSVSGGGYASVIQDASSSFGSWRKLFYQEEINDILSKLKNAQLLMMVAFVLFGQGDDMDTEVGGISDPMSALSSAQKQMATILQTFKSGSGVQPGGNVWSDQGALNFVQTVYNLQQEIDSGASTASVAAQLDQALGSILNIQLLQPGASGSSPVPTPQPGGGTGTTLNSIGDAFIDYMTAMQKGDSVSAGKDMAFISQTLNLINPSVPGNLPPSGSPVPQFNTFNDTVQNLQQSVTAIQDQSQLTATLLSQKTELYKQFLSMLESFISPTAPSLVTLTNTMIQNQKS